MDIVVRQGRPEDADFLVANNQAMARETEDKELDGETLRAGVEAVFADESRGFYLVAEYEGRSVGSLLVTQEWSDWRNGAFWWIQSVYVDRSARRRGVYRQLYDAVRERAREQGGVCGFRLYVERENFKARKAYEKLGMGETRYAMYESEEDDPTSSP
jgi:ribosomal protein S18 acetylase RimI-like enzyme